MVYVSAFGNLTKPHKLSIAFLQHLSKEKNKNQPSDFMNLLSSPRSEPHIPLRQALWGLLVILLVTWHANLLVQTKDNEFGPKSEQ